MAKWDSLWINADLATLVPGSAPLGAIKGGAIGVRGGRIAWIGPETELPGPPDTLARRVVDAGGGWITPGLIDCHTHLIFGGHRAGEFEQRLRGVSYDEIARAGGGIRSTVLATRAADDERLFAGAASRLGRLLSEGVTTVEIKSGYGLDTDTELRMLRIARRLGEAFPITVQTTLLGAHALPEELEGDRKEYLRQVREEMIPRAAAEGLADAVDAFCEGIAFSSAECEAVLEAGRAHGLSLRLHADQLSDSGGAALAARMAARSADHLEYASSEGVEAMGQSGTVAVLLPGAFYVLRERRLPPIERFRSEGVPIAIATDCNPGTSPVTSLLLIMNMACTLFGLTPEEALAGVTRNAARALGMEKERGMLREGMQADFVLWGVDEPAELSYWIGANPCRAVIRSGERTDPAPLAPAGS